MMSSLSLPTETQMGAIQKAVPMPTTTQAIRKPGKSGPAVFALCDPGPRLRDFSKKIYSKAKPSATSRQLGSRTEGFAKPISSQPAPSHRPWICARGATPIQTFTLSPSFPSYSVGTGIFLQARNSFLHERTCRINPRQVKQHCKGKMRLKRDKPGDALGRPSWQSWLLRDPGAKFLPQSGGKHEKYNLERMSTSITVQESEFEWPVLNRPQMAGFGVTTEASTHYQATTRSSD